MDYDTLLSWFTTYGGTLAQQQYGSNPVWTLHDFGAEHMGTGLVAATDLDENALLFTVPRSLVLSTRTSQLPELLHQSETSQPLEKSAPKWSQLAGQWTGLMLCMLWERARSLSGQLDLGGAKPDTTQWGEYLQSMPTEFDTPMFWSADQLNWLQGTSIQEKIGRAAADQAYNTLVEPLVRARPSIFVPGWNGEQAKLEEAMQVYYSLAWYHIMGSRILSRSFHVEERSTDSDDEEQQEDEEDEDAEQQDTSMKDADDSHISTDTKEHSTEHDHSHDHDHDEEEEGEENEDEEEEEEEEEGKESVDDIGMVCLADLLNARPGEAHNARLFYRTEKLEMRTTRPVKQGEQLFNTYADPPNSDLLRRYGHVDLHHPAAQDPLDNPNDNVELGWNCVIEAAVEEMRTQGASIQEAEQMRQDLIERFSKFEEGGLIPDESVALTYVPRDATRSYLEPSEGEDEDEDEEEETESRETGVYELFVGCKLAWCDGPTADKYLSKDHAPETKWSGMMSHKSSGRSMLAAQLAFRAIERRLTLYPANVQADEQQLASLGDQDRRHANALVVRIGEQRILHRLLALLQSAIQKYTAVKAKADAEGKSKANKRSAPASKGKDSKKAKK